MPSQAPQRQTTITPLTPVIGDTLVSLTQLYDRKVLPDYGVPLREIHTAGQQERFANHVLTHIEPLKDAREDMYVLYFAAPRDNQDAYSWETVQADIGGNRFDAVARTYVTTRASYKTSEPAMGSAMPAEPSGKFGSGFILAQKRQDRLPKELDGVFVAETHVYIRKTTITSIGTDPLNGRPLSSVSTIYHKDEIVTGSTTAASLFANPADPFWGVQATGYSNTGKQISSEFYEVVSEQVVGGTLSGGSITISDYFTTENYSWPAVLGSIQSDAYDLVQGGTEYYVYPKMSREAYSGPCRARVQIRWSPQEFSVSTPSTMRPLRIDINTPFYGVNIGPTLHGSVFLSLVISNHPKYESVAGTLSWPATSPTDWPASILASDEQRPYRGGWLRTTVTIYQPVFP